MKLRQVAWGALVGLVLLAAGQSATGCGDSSAPVQENRFSPAYEAPAGARSGGTLRVLTSGGIGSMDPGQVISQAAFMVAFSTQRSLLTASPDSESRLRPDLATAMPEIDLAARTMRVEIKSDVFYSPPVNRRVKSDDVKYAIERALLPGVANGEVEMHFGALVGFDQARKDVLSNPRKAPDIVGITTPAENLLEFHFKESIPPLADDFLTAMVTAPVPRKFAEPLDRSVPSGYGTQVVSSGPYMLSRDELGEVTGLEPGRTVALVRNPNWNPATDFRPAYLDGIEIAGGYSNQQVASNLILEGESMVNGDFTPTPIALERAATEFPEQLMIAPSSAILFASLNTRIPPFNDLNVRRAVLASVDRNAMRLAIGGQLAGHIATHFLAPGFGGFEEAGGFEGPGFDFLEDPEGNPELAARYMKKAGYPQGRYEGTARPVMVTDKTSQGQRFAEILSQGLDSIGIKVDRLAVSRDTMYSTFCNVPAKRVGTCPSVGWVGQFGDGQTMLESTFSGDAIRPVNNSNWPLLDVPGVNRAIERGKGIHGQEQRARWWGKVDRRITALAPAVPIVWRDIAYVSSANVNLVLEPNAVSPALPMISMGD